VDHRFPHTLVLGNDLKRAAKKVKLPAAQARRKDVLVFMDPACIELDEHIKAQNISCKRRQVDKKQKEDIDW
jgi:hypothetical protein